MMDELNKRKQREHCIEAAFHGIKLPMPSEIALPVDEPTSWVEEKAAQEAMLAAQERVKARYGR